MRKTLLLSVAVCLFALTVSAQEPALDLFGAPAAATSARPLDLFANPVAALPAVHLDLFAFKPAPAKPSILPANHTAAKPAIPKLPAVIQPQPVTSAIPTGRWVYNRRCGWQLVDCSSGICRLIQ